ncbi:HAD family hydrolase [Promicromonospora sp. MS192]|uniref:HAD family hydrolase n=1 Tax=Promicromonospora sp. MS192 TaxID=3412684 RepID=UPI003C2BFE27
MTGPAVLDLAAVDAVVLDTDGVVTDTARTHAAAWKRAFDEVLRDASARSGRPQPPFDVERDYLPYVDGRARADGARAFLASRGIVLPEGPGAGTLDALLARKNRSFLAEVAGHGVRAFPSTVALLRELRRGGVRVAVVSASRNCARVLHAAGMDGLVDVRVDGVDADRLGLAGKPDPALFLEAARRLGVPPGRCAVVEDALVGVEAGRTGGFAVVIGVDRHGRLAWEMREAGADVVVADLADVVVARRADAPHRPVV